MSTLIDDIATSIQRLSPLPVPEQPLSLEQAYEIQERVAARISPNGIAGIKAGVTAKPLQAMFKIDFALLGRLYENGRLQDGAQLPHLSGRLIECEIACICDKTGKVSHITPAIEFACARFAGPEHATAANLVAGNVAAEKFLSGGLTSYQDDFSSIILKLYCDDELVNEAPVFESLKGPVAAARWIMEEAELRGFDTGNENFLMTGACGKVIPAKPGHYRADYGELGTLSFSVSG